MSNKGTPLPCDQCRRRKVRCDYALPCNRCQSHSLACAYNFVRRKKGPKTGRGVVIDQLRAQPTTSPARVTIDEREAYETPPSATVDSGRDAALAGLVLPSNRHVSHARSSMTAQDLEDNSSHSHLGSTCFTFDEFAQNVLASSSTTQLSNSGVDSTWLQPRIRSTSQAPLSIDQLNSASTAPESVSPVANLPSPYDFDLDQTIEHSVDLFFKHTYPIYPILDETSVRSLLSGPRRLHRVEAGLLWSMSALTLVSVDCWPTMDTESRTMTARDYIKQCLAARMSVDFVESATIQDVLTSLFIAITYFDLKCRRTSWYYLREAISLAHVAGIHLAAKNTMLEPIEKLRHQRIYALLYITERGACVHDNFPVSILVPPELPCSTLPQEDPAISIGLSSIFHLFSLLDMKFVNSWNEASLSPSTMQELASLQSQLCQSLDLRGASETQRADVLITQQWLRLMVWQAALRLGLISSSAQELAFSYTYPLEIASSLCDVLKTLAPMAIQVHGLGIFEKQFEIAYSLLDALTLSETSTDHYETLRYLLLSLSALPKSREVYVRILQRKMGQDDAIGVDQRHVHLANVVLLRDAAAVGKARDNGGTW